MDSHSSQLPVLNCCSFKNSTGKQIIIDQRKSRERERKVKSYRLVDFNNNGKRSDTFFVFDRQQEDRLIASDCRKSLDSSPSSCSVSTSSSSVSSATIATAVTIAPDQTASNDGASSSELKREQSEAKAIGQLPLDYQSEEDKGEGSLGRSGEKDQSTIHLADRGSRNKTKNRTVCISLKKTQDQRGRAEDVKFDLSSRHSTLSQSEAIISNRNSQLVRRRASAKDELAAASLTAGASVPLMIGNRGRCVINVIEKKAEFEEGGGGVGGHNNGNAINTASSTQSQETTKNQAQVSTATPTAHTMVTGARNTAMRAEQRQHQQAVVRPVMLHERRGEVLPTGAAHAGHLYNPLESPVPVEAAHRAIIGARPELQSAPVASDQSSIIENWMQLDRRLKSVSAAAGDYMLTKGVGASGQQQLDELLLQARLGSFGIGSGDQHHHLTGELDPSDYGGAIARQQTMLLRREECELNRGIRRQHQFVVSKLEKRQRQLQIVQSVWVQRDFKHAIESLIDLYSQGLIFLNDSDPTASASASASAAAGSIVKNATSNQLTSLNTALVVDMIGVMLLRPKLWSLEICQLLMPIIVNDLLAQNLKHFQPRFAGRAQHHQPQQPNHQGYEHYFETALKSIKLVLTHFSSIIQTTLEMAVNEHKSGNNNQSATTAGVSSGSVGRVDLTREDRINKCLNCYRLLLDAKHLIIGSLRRVNQTNGNQTKATSQAHANAAGCEQNDCQAMFTDGGGICGSLCREIVQLLSSLESSFSMDPIITIVPMHRRRN